MRKHELTTGYHDYFEYFGNTEIERIRRRAGHILRRDWIIFDFVVEAIDSFNHKRGASLGCYV